MANLNYFMNLQRAFPASMLPRQVEIVKAWHQQSPVKMVMVIPTRKTGSYKIQCTSAEDYVALENFSLELPLQGRSLKIPLEKPYKLRNREDFINFDGRTVRVTLVGAGEDELALEKNESFDAYFSEYGEIVSPTKFDKCQDTDVFDGKRSFVIKLHEGKEIEREISYSCSTGEEKHKIIKVYYRGQPYWCRFCNEKHTERCQKIEQPLTPQQKADREKEVKTLIVADSQVKMLDDKKLSADVVSVPGGKIGHLANSLNWNKKLVKYDNVVIIGGTNNVHENTDESIDEAKEEVRRGLQKVNMAVKETFENSPQKKLIIMEQWHLHAVMRTKLRCTMKLSGITPKGKTT